MKLIEVDNALNVAAFFGNTVPSKRGQFIHNRKLFHTRFIETGYRHIHLYTEHWRLAALKIYLKLGYVPYLYTAEMAERWRAICAQLGWPYTPEVWL